MEVEKTRRTDTNKGYKEILQVISLDKLPKERASLFEFVDFNEEDLTNINKILSFNLFRNDKFFKDEKEKAIKKLKDIKENSLLSEISKNEKIYSDNEILELLANSNQTEKEKILLKKDEFGYTFLHYANTETLKKILENIKDNKELLEKIILETDNYGYTLLHYTKADKTKLILDVISKDEKLLEKALLAKKNNDNDIPLRYADAYKTKIILDAIGNNENLLEKVLLSKGCADFTILHFAEFEKIKIILKSLENKKELLEKILLAKDIGGYTPLHSNILIQYNPEIQAIFKSIDDMSDKTEAKKLLEKLLTEKNNKNRTIYQDANIENKQLIEFYAQFYNINFKK